MDFYDIRTGDTIHFKKRIRPLKVKLMDGTIKTVLIDESAPVSEVVDTVCRRIGIANGEEYSLLSETANDLAGSATNLSRTETMRRGKAKDGTANTEPGMFSYHLNTIDVFIQGGGWLSKNPWSNRELQTRISSCSRRNISFLTRVWIEMIPSNWD